MTTAAREYSKVVPADFASALAAAFPRADGLAYLHARWEPGDDWAPVERFVIWEIHPWALVPAEDQALVRRALEGPSPRGVGHYCAAGYCACDLKKNRWTGGPHEGTDYYQQWAVHREVAQLGAPGYPRAIWVVQGERGGHPFTMDAIEAQLAAAADMPTRYPAVGELPYAPLDRRVILGLLRHDRLRDAKGMVGRLRTGAELAALDASRAQHAADALFEFLADTTHQSAEEWAFWEKRATGHLVNGTHGEALAVIDRDESKRRFIEDMAVVPVSV